MQALLFGVRPRTAAADVPPELPDREAALESTPMDIRELEDPALKAPDWLVIKPTLTGICGSDTKQVLGDGDPDNAMSAVISFPQVLGHEMVGVVVEAGPDSGHAVGDRVVLNPWLSCGPRGISPVCDECADGNFSSCVSFMVGSLAPGIHSGNSKDATGAFAELVPAHAVMAIPVPDDVPDEVAVLADPFSVSLHSVLRNPPPPGGRALVYGVGALGLTTCAVLKALYPDVEVAAVARYPFQARLAEKQGAVAFEHEPREKLISLIADWSGATLRHPFIGLDWTYPGGVDVIYETVAAPESLEVSVRVAKQHGSIVITGVGKPGRFEWTPWYFKELTLSGANGFGYETVDGVHKHAMTHYFDLVSSGRVDVSEMLTHRFPLSAWRDAFATLARQEETGAFKVAFDFR